MGYLSCWKRNPLPPAGIIPVFPVVLSGRSTSDGTFWGHNSINFDNKYNFKYPKKPTFLFCLYPCVSLGWTGDLSSALCKISQDRHSLLWLSYDCYKMLMKEVFLRGVKEHWELYLFPARCSAADTQLCSSNTQSANQILLFEICQALDYFPFKLSFIILMESVHLVPHFCSLLQRTNVIPPHVRRTKHDA